MSATFDSAISVVINLDTPPITSQGFGTVLLASGVDPGFDDVKVRTYASAKAVDADNDLVAGLKIAVKAAFAQGEHVQMVKVGDARGDNLTAGLAAIAAEDNDWYGLALNSRVAADNTEAATWAETAQKLFVAQTSDADVLVAGDTDIASTLKTASRLRTSVLWHHSDVEWAALAWLADRLGADPDVQTTIWKFVTLSGITPSKIDDTKKGVGLGKGANLYLTFGGQGSTGNGTLADGHKIDELITADWLRVRIAQDLKQLLLDYSNRRQKIPYTDKGFQILGQAARSRLNQGERVGHFEEGTSAVQLPKKADIPQATQAIRHYGFSLSTQPAGAIESTGITGYVSLNV